MADSPSSLHREVSWRPFSPFCKTQQSSFMALPPLLVTPSSSVQYAYDSRKLVSRRQPFVLSRKGVPVEGEPACSLFSWNISRLSQRVSSDKNLARGSKKRLQPTSSLRPGPSLPGFQALQGRLRFQSTFPQNQKVQAS